MATVIAPVETSGVDWKAVIAGAIAAAAISGLLTAFGAAIGLSLTSAHRTGLSVTTLAIAAAIWLVMVHVWSFTAGGYLARPAVGSLSSRSRKKRNSEPARTASWYGHWERR